MNWKGFEKKRLWLHRITFWYLSGEAEKIHEGSLNMDNRYPGEFRTEHIQNTKSATASTVEVEEAIIQLSHTPSSCDVYDRKNWH
jgi:hypothetical protein